MKYAMEMVLSEHSGKLQVENLWYFLLYNRVIYNSETNLFLYHKLK